MIASNLTRLDLPAVDAVIPGATPADAPDRGSAGGDTARPSMIGRHISSLDALRGLAILIVMLYHFNHHVRDNSNLLSKTAFNTIRLGGSGVDLFFVLSGFLITGILYDSRHSSGFFRTFYIRRALRIFPLYYGVLLIFTIVVPLFSASSVFDWKSTILWVYGTNFAQAIHADLSYIPRWGYFWSLAVEEHFYLAWPLVIYWCSRRKCMGICLGLIAMAFVSRWIAIVLFHQPVAAYVLTPCRMDSLAAGALVALAFRGSPSRNAVRYAAVGLVAVSGLSLAGLFISHQSAEEMDSTIVLWRYLLSSLFFSGLLILVLQAAPGTLWGRFWNNGLLRMLGKYSYGLYVYHTLLREACREWVDPNKLAQSMGSVLLAQIAFSGLCCVLSLAAAVASWHLFERHFVKLKDVLAPQPAPSSAKLDGPKPAISPRCELVPSATGPGSFSETLEACGTAKQKNEVVTRTQRNGVSAEPAAFQRRIR